MSVRCLSCGYDNPPEARFCAKCGNTLVTVTEPCAPEALLCNACQQYNPSEARFCGNCGAPIPTKVQPTPPAVVPSHLPRLRKSLLFGGLAIIIIVAIGFSVTTLLFDFSITSLLFDGSRQTPPPPPPQPVPAPSPIPPPPKVTILPEVYVDSNYKGSSTGTKERPFTTIQEGIDRSSGIVKVAAGVYREAVDLKDDIVLLGAGPDKSVIYGNVMANNITGAKICGFTITDNNTAGIHCYFSSVTIANNIIINQPGCGIGGHDNSLAIINNLIAGNGASGIGFGENCDLTIKNNILFNNDCGIQYGSGASCFIDYNLMWNNLDGDYGLGILPGPNDIYADPLFVDIASENFQLQPDSPCIDAGDPDPQHNDADGSRNDIGAFGGPAEFALGF